jgi:hypothetical protein
MRISIGAILVVLLFLDSCTYNIHHEIDESVLKRRPLVESLPVTVGIYFSPEFRTYHSNNCESAFPLGTFCNEYNLGPSSVALFEIVFAGLFDKVLVIDSTPPRGSNLNVAGTISPAIAAFNVKERQITYRMTLYSPAGTELGMWEVEGLASTGGVFSSDLVRLAMRAAAAKFVKGFHKEPVVIRWLEDAGVKVSLPTDPQNKEGVAP